MRQGFDLEELQGLTIAELRRRWDEVLGGRKAPPKVRIVLLRDLAWHAQQAGHGGLDAQTRALLKSAVKQAEAQPSQPRPREGLRISPRDQAQAQPPCEGQPKVKRPRKPPRLATGTQLIRTWRGQTHEVTVLENGKRFAYRDKSYASLTRIAQAITGAHWSGPRFFGLNRVRSIQ